MNNIEIATLAGGCFWCTEAIFKRLKGIISVKPGYAGGSKENPTYEEVSSGQTGHAESIQIEFDSSLISFEKILEVFWHTHNPTTLNQQGNDIGTQYRSVIFAVNTDVNDVCFRGIDDVLKCARIGREVNLLTSAINYTWNMSFCSKSISI